jgi:hypothetical protein
MITILEALALVSAIAACVAALIHSGKSYDEDLELW